MREEAVLFGERQYLVGIVNDPDSQKGNHSKAAVILLNPGVVHRVAPGRIYVKIARALAAMGFIAFRFDFSGIGDSPVRYDNLPFDRSAVKETQDAMHFLQTTRDVQRFILLGGCSGARVSLQTACCDSRVAGAFLINLQMSEDDDQSLDQISRTAAFYYWNFALFDLKSWRKLLTGKADYRKILRALGFQARSQLASARKMSPETLQLASNLRRLADRGVCVTFLYAESDPRLNDLRQALGREFKQLREMAKMRLEIIPRSDHTFSSLLDQDRLLKRTCEVIEATTSAMSCGAIPQQGIGCLELLEKTLP